MFDLFGEEVATPLTGIDLESAPIPRGEILAWEKELLGVYLSEHPFTRAAAQLAPYVSAVCNEFTPEMLADLPSQGRDFVVAGMVGSMRRLSTRDGRGFIAAGIEDLSGSIEVTVWPDIYERTTDLWVQGRILLLQLRVRERGDRLSAGVNEVAVYNEDFAPPHWALESAAGALTTRRANGNGDAYPQPDADTAPPSAMLVDTLPEPVVVTGADEPFEVRPTFVESRIAEEPPRYAPEPESAPIASVTHTTRLPLSLVLVESDDEAADQRRLATVFRLLQDNPGNDAVLLKIRTREGDAIDLALPTAALDEGVRAALLEAVGTADPVLS
jgi:DNA polymerase-3 subunit alpha